MTLSRFFKKKSPKPEEVFADCVQVRAWYKFVEGEEGSACVALTMEGETRLIFCNYAGQINEALRYKIQDKKLNLALIQLGEDDFSHQFVYYKPKIKKNIELIFEFISKNEDEFSTGYLGYKNDVKVLLWNLFVLPPIINYEADNISWGKLQNCMAMQSTLDKHERKEAQKRDRGHTL